MPPLAIYIEGTFEKEDLFRITSGTPETIIAAALLAPLDIRNQDLITLLTNANCQRDDAIQIMREVRRLLGRRANGRNMRAYQVVEEIGQLFLENPRQDHRNK